ncbi:recombinase family protein [Streptomyces sp. NBC_01619]|nr:recombinase family protein [Streptomyces sp. NBC_01619]MCX4510538.1 recombinase family protein [Streptomyces sp. NBC_01619]
MDEIERPYDGCGKCLLGVRRLSRVKAATTSPERQREDVLTAAAAIGGHIIDWADDWEVSGATDPMTRPKLGPWLRDERGKYDGLVAAAVDRLGRNVVDCLNTGYKMRDEGKLLVSYGHDGVWNLDDPNDENRFTMEAWGAQMELRAIQRRNRDATKNIRAAGRPKGKSSYGFQYVRTVPNGRVDRVELHPHAAEVLRNVARPHPRRPRERVGEQRDRSPEPTWRAVAGRPPCRDVRQAGRWTPLVPHELAQHAAVRRGNGLPGPPGQARHRPDGKPRLLRGRLLSVAATSSPSCRSPIA